MDVVFTLSNLLFEYDQVIVNGLGVFTTELENASIHPVEHSFLPESKKIRFKYDENAKDDFLVQRMGTPDAATFISSFVEKVKQELKEGKKVQIKNIGYLYAHHTGEIILEQDHTFNYVKKNFGLQGLIQEPVNKIVSPDKPIAPIVAHIEKKKSKLGMYIAIVVAILIASLVFWKWDNLYSLLEKEPIVEATQVVNQNTIEATPTPILDSSENVIDSQDTLSDTYIYEENQDSVYNQDIEDEEIPIEEPVEEPITIEEPQGPVFYVIAGCFRSEYKAERLLEDLKKSGFDQASIEGKTPNGLIRVCYASYPKRRQASNYMLKLQNQGRKGVWIQENK